MESYSESIYIHNKGYQEKISKALKAKGIKFSFSRDGKLWFHTQEKERVMETIASMEPNKQETYVALNIDKSLSNTLTKWLITENIPYIRKEKIMVRKVDYSRVYAIIEEIVSKSSITFAYEDSKYTEMLEQMLTKNGIIFQSVKVHGVSRIKLNHSNKGEWDPLVKKVNEIFLNDLRKSKSIGSDSIDL